MRIIAEISISEKGLTINDQTLMTFESDNWLKEAYVALKLEYPKFYKMDILSKMAFICVEQLKQSYPTNWWVNENLPQIIANSNASKYTDVHFEASYKNGASPSPSLFVYTLPNIVTGELAIRNKWYGQNWFFVQQELDWNKLEEQIIINLFDYKGIVLCGWTDIDQTLASANATFRLIEHN